MQTNRNTFKCNTCRDLGYIKPPAGHEHRITRCSNCNPYPPPKPLPHITTQRERQEAARAISAIYRQ